MNADQLDLFASSMEPFKFGKRKIKLIECFGGIGSQARALEALQEAGALEFEHHRLVEWAVPSIIAYNAIHVGDWSDHSEGKTKEELVQLTAGISMDYNKPMTEEQRAKKGEKWLRRVYSSMVATKDFCPDVSRVHCEDLGIEDDGCVYVLTYSFPCQDLSLAGNLAGFKKGSGTRSGLLWEIERILLECKERGRLPDVLLMENVRGVMSDAESWGSWDAALMRMGYTNYVQILNAKNYGIPQNRERCFMVSIRGDYGYHFPTPYKREHNLKDFLDQGVEERFYLSEKMIQYVTANNEKWTGNNSGAIVNKEVGCCINTAPTSRRCDASNYISDQLPENTDIRPIVVGNYSRSGNFGQRAVISDQGISNTITTGNHGEPTAVQLSEKEVSNSIRCGGRGSLDRHEWDLVAEPTIQIKDATAKGYREARDGDGVDVSSRMETHRGTVQDGTSLTIKTTIDVGVCVKNGK